MERYNILETIGEGAFGTVSRATNQEGKQFAIKCMKASFRDWNDIQKHREFQAVVALTNGCSHLVRVFEILREKDSKLYFVCEFMPDGDLKDYLHVLHTNNRVVEPPFIKSILSQVLRGLQHIHSRGFMHRDLKPENLLMSGGKCKVADFSLARLSVLDDMESNGMTNYVSSRWYRAPEIILAAKSYTTAVDIFALGCIMAELHLLVPLFPGKDEHDQLPLILQLLGPLNRSTWNEGALLLERMQVNIPPSARPDKNLSIKQRLENKFRISEMETIAMLASMLELNPAKRPTATEALRHPYMNENTFTWSQSQTMAALDYGSSHIVMPSKSSNIATNSGLESTPVRATEFDCSQLELAPVVTVSPSARKNETVNHLYHLHNMSSKEMSPLGYLGTAPGSRVIPASEYPRVPKRRRSEYQPSQVFHID